MADKCSIAGCDQPAVASARFDNTITGELVLDLKLCKEHGEAIRKTYFPDAPKPNPCAEIPINLEVSKEK